jgi:hypothetical protein
MYVDNSLSVAWWAGGGHGRPLMVIRGTKVHVRYVPSLPDYSLVYAHPTFCLIYSIAVVRKPLKMLFLAI